MANRPPDFDAELAALPPERFAALVADLWAARGQTVRRADGLVHATDPSTGEARTLCPCTADDARSIPEDVDAVVHAGEEAPAGVPAEAEVVGPMDVYELVRYAIPREDTERLLTEYLDASLVPEPPGAFEGDVADTAVDGTDDAGITARSEAFDSAVDHEPDATNDAEGGHRRPRRRTVLLGAGAFLAGLGAAAASGVGPFDGTAGAESGEPPPSTPDAPETAPVAGLTATSVGSPRTFAVGHVDRLAETSFTIDSRKTIYAADGRLLSSVVVAARLTADRQFRVSAAAEGPAGRPIFGELPASAELWSDGETYVRRITTDEETTYEEYRPGITINDWYLWSSIIPFGGPPYSAFEFYRDFFEAVPVSVDAAGDAPYDLTAFDEVLDPAPLLFGALDLGTAVDELDVVALVTDPGLIRSLVLRYGGLQGGNPVDVRWSIAYGDVGETTVERPSWADRALDV